MHVEEQNVRDRSCYGQSISEMLKQVMRQVEYPCFADLRFNRIDPFYKELCFVIAEVLILDPVSFVKINGSNMYTHLVQEVYSLLRNDHVRLVFKNFHNVPTHVYNKKAYLRTALYNAVFEIESNAVNNFDCI